MGASSSASRFALAAAGWLSAACGAEPSPSSAPTPPASADTASPSADPASPATRRPDVAGGPSVPEPERACAPLVVLIPSDDATVTTDLADGLRAAFDEARRAGGPDLQLRLANPSPRWGSQVEEAVRLAVDEGAVAFVAPPERRPSHLLAQLATRVKVPMISTARDPRVAAAGSTWLVTVAPQLTIEEAQKVDGLPAPPVFDPPERRPWERVGREAGRRVVLAVRAVGLQREGFVEAARAGAAK